MLDLVFAEFLQLVYSVSDSRGLPESRCRTRLRITRSNQPPVAPPDEPAGSHPVESPTRGTSKNRGFARVRATRPNAATLPDAGSPGATMARAACRKEVL